MGVPLSTCIALDATCHDAIASSTVAPTASAAAIACCAKYAAMIWLLHVLFGRQPFDLPLLCWLETMLPRDIFKFPWLPFSPRVVEVPLLLREVFAFP